MSIRESIKQVRATVLILGAAAFLPLSAYAMVTDHDTSDAEATGSAGKIAGETDRSLALRFGTWSGLGANGSSNAVVGSDEMSNGTGTAGPESSDVYNRLP